MRRLERRLGGGGQTELVSEVGDCGPRTPSTPDFWVQGRREEVLVGTTETQDDLLGHWRRKGLPS